MIDVSLDFIRAAAQSIWEIRHPDGSLYLRRNVLHGADSLDTHDPTAPWSAYIHEIATPDGDRHMHDHPWAWAVAIVLSGGYTEIRTTTNGPRRWRSHIEGDLNTLMPGDYHSITHVMPDTRTLFLCGHEISDWGFLVNGSHVSHGEYFERTDAQHMTHTRTK